MPRLRQEVRGGGGGFGGAIGYRPEQIFEEVAYLAYHFHWPYTQLMTLDHLERRRWVEETAKIVDRINDAQTNSLE
ncbi:DUF6760 family protein [Caballeronia humi]|uniref:DUF6760 family protein n=1 Tax=Caballeronia humi TaxID=326474 RepID=UPI000B3E88A5|nr:DUF6760 family protein [Caballeronia humi]